MSLNVPAHAHCVICDQVVQPDTKVCGDDCQERYDEGQRYKKRQAWIFIGIMATLLILFNLLRMGII